MMRSLILGLTCFFVLQLSAVDRAKADHPELAELMKKGPDALLAAADQRHNDFTDQILDVELTLGGGSDAGKVLGFVTHTKGDMRALRFKKPADMKGMGVVVRGTTEIYVRLPGAKKPRRVASHARRQSFMGSDWSMDDIGLVRFGTKYSAKLKSQTDKHVVLSLTRNSGVDLPYASLELHIDKDILLIEKIRYYSDAGKLVKTQDRGKPIKSSIGKLFYGTNTVTTVSTGHFTVTNVISEKSNVGLSKRVFTKRWLARGM